MYQITIKKIGSQKVTEKVWQRLFDSPDNGSWERSKVEGQYDYVEVENTKRTETLVLEQTVDELNLQEVIKAVNGIN